MTIDDSMTWRDVTAWRRRLWRHSRVWWTSWDVVNLVQ